MLFHNYIVHEIRMCSIRENDLGDGVDQVTKPISLVLRKRRVLIKRDSFSQGRKCGCTVP